MAPRPSDLDAALRDIRDSAEAAERYIRGVTEQEFLDNDEKQDAVIRRIEVMGEAAARIMRAIPDYEATFPSLPLRTIYAMRNRIVHGYDGINLKTVWNTATRDAPQLRRMVETVIAERATGT